jgi:hypothetical protein
MTTAINRQMNRVIPFHLATARTAVGAGLAVNITVQVPGDADFEVRYINGSFTSVNATMVVRDSGTRLELMNQACMVALITGIGQQPYVLPQPALFQRNSNIEVVLTDLSGAPNTMQIVFCGFLLYPAPTQQM